MKRYKLDNSCVVDGGLSVIDSLDAIRDQLGQVWTVFEAGRARGLHLGLQLYVSRDHVPLVDVALGENQPGAPLTVDHVLPWLSAGKPITAVAIMQLVEAGQLDLDQPIANQIPEFAQNSKEAITTRHLLTHTAGIDAVALGWPQSDWDTVIQRICAAPLKAGAIPGEAAGYDPQRSWFILGELVQRLRQESITDYVRRELMEPLGMTGSWLGVPSDVIARNSVPWGQVYQVTEGKLRPNHSQRPEMLAYPAPGSSCRGPIRELGRFYEMLLSRGHWNGKQFLRSETVDWMTRRHRVGMFDQTFQHTVDFGLGVITNSNRYGSRTIPYGFGQHSSEGAFGHGGSQSSIGFADPQHRLVVSAIANGYPGEVPHNRRFRELLTALYDDLGLGPNATAAT